MFQIKLKNNKIFSCDKDSTIFESAKLNNIVLEHSCLSARCRSCMVKIVNGKTKNKIQEFVLSEEDKHNNYVLSCNAIPISDVTLDNEDLGNLNIYEKKIIPVKIDKIEKLTDLILKLTLRFPPNANFKFIPGQYINLIKDNIKRSYSIASPNINGNSIELFIKKYDDGLMSNYLFCEARLNDLLRIEGPIGSFFFRESRFDNIIFLATGTGVAPIRSILHELENNSEKLAFKNIYVFVGTRYTVLGLKAF